VAKGADPYFLQQIFKVGDVSQIDRAMSEDEIFYDYQASPYLTSLYNIINSLRYQTQPYCELKILVEGDLESDQTLNSFMILDNKNQVYQQDHTGFIAMITGSGGGGTGSHQPHAAYY
jgi:hypothetical protein